jgi:hypothetical protein
MSPPRKSGGKSAPSEIAAPDPRDNSRGTATPGCAPFAEAKSAGDSAAPGKTASETAGPEKVSSEPRALIISEWYTPFPRQREFHESGAKYRLFGGAAGPGKTKALLWEAIRQANRYPRVDTLILRRTFPELESSLIAYFRRDVPRELYRSYNESKHVVTWHNGSTTRFGHCAHENDIYQYQGAEYLFIGLDETTHFTLKQWQFLTSRNRCPVRGTFPNMAGATNPGNIGHAWVKALWIDKRAPAGMERADNYDPRDYDFVKATVADNPIYADDREYRRTLDSLPTHLRRAFLEGDWNVFAGQYFDVFNQARHVVRLSHGNLGVRGIAGVTQPKHSQAENDDAIACGVATLPKYSQFENEGEPGFDCHPEGIRPAMPEGSVCEHHRDVASGSADDDSSHRSFVANNAPQDDNLFSRAPHDENEILNSAPQSNFTSSPEAPASGRTELSRTGAAPRQEPGGSRGIGGSQGPGGSRGIGGSREIGGSPENDNALALVSLEPWWTRWISIDWGFEHPSAVLWHAAAPDGCVVTYREFVQNRLSPRMLAAAIAERCAGERIGATYLSPDAFAQRSADDTIAEQLARGLEMEGLPRPDPADNDRVGGWMLMYEMLREDAWLITRNCVQLIESLPTLTRDEHNIEDVLKCAGDDVADAARYGIKSRLDPRHSPHAGFAEQVMRRGERISAEDPTSRAIWMRQVEAEARRKRGGAPAPRRWRI